MVNTYYSIAMISAGAALITGLISLMIGFRKEGDRVDRIFGVQAISLFIFLLVPPAGYIIGDKPPYPLSLEIKRIFIWAYYILMPFFFEAYTGHRKPYVNAIITASALVAYLLMIFAGAGAVMPAWELLVIVTHVMILGYGIILGRLQYRDGSRSDARWLLAAMALFGFCLGMHLLRIFGQPVFTWIFGEEFSFPFHINTFAFIFIIALRMRARAFNLFRLERILRIRNERWESLQQNVQTMIIEVDKDGKITYMNPFAIQRLGYAEAQEVMGRSLFEVFVTPTEIEDHRARFRRILETGVIAEHESAHFLTKSGLQRKVKWSGVINRDDEGRTSGVMLIGLDMTDLENASQEVQSLKNELDKENFAPLLEDRGQVTHEIIGQSAAITYAIQKARQVAGTHATVLLEGETGVGKEMFADLIHRYSSRSSMPLVKVNCAALPPELIESELFGHEKGSFTGAVQARKGRFEMANGGTIFLDEIGEMPLSLQPKLLRVLQEGEFQRIGGQQSIRVDVRVISATNRDLHQLIREGLFREDLFYRLNVFPITIPALRNRKEDIPLLVNHFIRKYAAEFSSQVENISRADLQRLEEYHWPGNIRELINLLARSIISSPGRTLKISWESNGHSENGRPLEPLAIKDLERGHILKVLAECRWRINGAGGAAEKLGMNPNTLRSRMKKLNISREDA
jgi:PAS domain S-box-containing protein